MCVKLDKPRSIRHIWVKSRWVPLVVFYFLELWKAGGESCSEFLIKLMTVLFLINGDSNRGVIDWS